MRTASVEVAHGVEWLPPLKPGWRLLPLWSMFERVKDVDHPDERMLSVFRDYGVVAKDSRGNLGVLAACRPCSPAITQVDWISHTEGCRANTHRTSTGLCPSVSGPRHTPNPINQVQGREHASTRVATRYSQPESSPVPLTSNCADGGRTWCPAPRRDAEIEQ